MKNLGTGLLTLALAVLPARAQEPWDTSFTLLAGTVSGADDALLGQSRSVGLSIQGAYPLVRNGYIVFEGGYRYIPTTTRMVGSTALEYKSDGYFGTMGYRYIVFDAWYAQAGLRLSQMRNMLRERQGTYSIDHGKGPSTMGLAPMLAVGYRFTDKYGLEVSASSLTVKNQVGVEKKSLTLDLGLAIHFGK